MAANTAQSVTPAVQEKSLVRTDAEIVDANLLRHNVRDLVTVSDIHRYRIQVRITPTVPQVGLGDRDALNGVGRAVSSHLIAGTRFSNLVPLGIGNCAAYGGRLCEGVRVAKLRSDLELGNVRIHAYLFDV